ncbi:MAG: hypothetical protein IJI49_01905 [Bacilli bacterium]|nr:hypothetical protein [Bacilli bacterium]
MKRIYLIIPLVLVIFITIGFSALETNLLVDNIGVVVRSYKLIRVTNVENPITSNSATSKAFDYNVDNINGMIQLPNSNSEVTYYVTVTNLGNVDIGILNIETSTNGNTNVLEATINPSDYTLGNKLCNANSVCNGGISKSFRVTIKYKTGVSAINGDIEFIATFNFVGFYSITYNGFDSVSGLPTEVMGGNTINIDFDSNINGVPYDVQVTGANSNYTSPPTLVLSDVTDNVIVNRLYHVTYTGFHDTTGLPTTIPYNGGSIAFDSNDPPNQVIVTGANSNYTSPPTLVLSNVTNNVSITAKYSLLLYTTIQNTYNNPPSNSGLNCNYTILPDDTTDENLRYVGSTPCNYIYFNNSNWRIIGIFDVDGEKLVKIVNSSFTSNVAFHNRNKKNFEKWPASSLATTLNSTFYNQVVSNGYGDLIKEVYWNVGKPTSNAVPPKQYYNGEIATKGDSTANIGLLNVSDILYATSGPTNGDRTAACLNTNVYATSGSNRWSSTGCISSNAIVNDWLYSGNNEWTIDADAGNTKVYRMQSNAVPAAYTVTNNTTGYREVVYLKENIKVDSGNGSSGEPYRVSLVQN